MAEQPPRPPEDEVTARKRELEEWKRSVDWDNKDPIERVGLVMLHAGAQMFAHATPEEIGTTLTEGMADEQRDPVMRFLYNLRDKEKAEPIKKERAEKTGGSLWGSSLAAVGGIVGASFLIGKVLMKWMGGADFNEKGITTKNKDIPESFKETYDWLFSGKKKAA